MRKIGLIVALMGLVATLHYAFFSRSILMVEIGALTLSGIDLGFLILVGGLLFLLFGRDDSHR